MSDSETFLQEIVNDHNTRLLDTLKRVVRQHHNTHPRSQQTTLGPSQIGHECPRNIASHVAELPPVNPPFDPLPSYIGVAAHKHLEDAVALDNQVLASQGQPPRWISERKLRIDFISGTADLFDLHTSTVIDLKFPGATAHTNYRKGGPSEVYRTQVHLYGYGYEQEGIDVETVGIWFIPRGGTLANSFLWTEPYDRTVALAALHRYENLLIVADELAIDRNPEQIAAIPKQPGKHCGFCPWYTKDQAGQPVWACNADGQSPHGKK